MRFELVLRREDLDDSKLRVKSFGRYITVMWCKQSSQISKQMILLHKSHEELGLHVLVT